MEVVQFFESTVGERDEGLAVRFLSIPQRSLNERPESNDQPAVKDALAKTLEIPQLYPVPAHALAHAVEALLGADESAKQQHLLLAWIGAGANAGPVQVTPRSFAEYIAYADVVPFSESPISLVSLASKAAGLARSPASLGAFIGVVAGGFTPLLIVTVPAGIILCGTAVAFAKAVDARRDQILAKFLGLPAKKRD